MSRIPKASTRVADLESTEPVTDLAGVLSPQTVGELNQKIKDFKARTNPQVVLAVAIVRTTGDREEAADALQDALISAFRHADSFRGQAAVTTWLHRIVVNACLDRHRRAAARPTISYQATREDDTRSGLPEPADPRSEEHTSELQSH